MRNVLRYFFNNPAAQMPTALNQRVWDVPGVCGFLITDAQEDALEFFEEDVDMVFIGV